MQRIGIIGCGNLSRAVVVPFAQENSSIEFICYTPTLTRAEELADIIDGTATDKPLDLKNLDGYLIACKPQQFKEMAADFKDCLAKNSLILSVMAGIQIDQIEQAFDNPNIIRLMPNTGSFYKKGVTLFYGSANVQKKYQDFAKRFAASFSKVYVMDSEQQLDDLTVFTGSGPGILFELFLNMSSSLEKYNISSELAEEMIRATVLSTSALLENSKLNIKELRNQVTSKKGITEATLKKLNELSQNEKQFDEIFKAGIARGHELKK